MYGSKVGFSTFTVASAVSLVLVSGASLSQGIEDGELGEVIVTATRSAVAINRVAISMAAVTGENITQQGIKDVGDLARQTPSVNFRRYGENNSSISIRGLTSSLGAPTTGIYLDDVPIQKRDTNGAVTGNGSPFPLLYDLDRIEILRGPQGTLYGGSAQGGAIRFITPTPSLTETSMSVKAEASLLEGGSPGHELGFAAGGPLVEDRVGVRAALFTRRQGGYLDHVSLYDGREFAKDTNWKTGVAGRLSALVKVTDTVSVTPALYYSRELLNNVDTYYRNIPQFTLNSGVFTNRGTTPSGVAYDFPDTTFAGGTFGPYDYFGKFRTYQGYYPSLEDMPRYAGTIRRQEITLPSLNIDWDVTDNLLIKSITSYVDDISKGHTGGTSLGHRLQVYPASTNAQFVDPGSVSATCNESSKTDDGICRVPVVNGVGKTALFIPGFPQRYSELHYSFSRRAVTQEIRFQFTPDEGRFSWIAGAFFTDSSYKQTLIEPGNEEPSAIFLRGVGEEWFMGQTNFTLDGSAQPLPVGVQGSHSYRDQTTTEKEQALFGEVTYSITSNLKATAGLRYSQVKVGYLQYTGASVFANPDFGTFVGTPRPPERITSPDQGHPFANQPGDVWYNVVQGNQNEKPISPKFGLSWQMTPTDLFYATYSTGYRAGGVNQPAPPTNCQRALEALGITGTPVAFKSDKVASYEVGAKNRVGPVQINSSVYYIKWMNPQIGQRLTECGHAYVDNAGSAASKGFDTQVVANAGPFVLQGSIAYTDARYTEDVFLNTPPGAPLQAVVHDGDTLGGVPKWQASAGVQYNFQAFEKDSYLRADYQYADKYFRTTGPGTVTYQPLAYQGPSSQNLNVRFGLRFQNNIEAALWSNNVTNESTVLSVGNTPGSVVVSETAVRPREIGATITWRH